MERPIKKGERPITVTQYDVKGKLPNPFIFDDGSEVKSVEDWERRRKEIYKTAVELQYGKQPPKPEFFEAELLNNETPESNTIYKIYTGTNKKQVSFTVKIMRPKNIKDDRQVPCVVCGDASFKYSHNADYCSALIDNGIALVLFDRLELAHDTQNEGRSKGALYQIYPEPEYDFGAIGAWAWGYSRCVDLLEKLPYIDKSCIAFTGHSRGGKTAMLAGVLDERCTIVNPNDTNQGSCSCYRIYMRADIHDNGINHGSETLKHCIDKYGFWFGKGMADYVGREEELPFDAHYLKALVAPRKLCVWESANDIWTNPIGSWQTTQAAKEVYKLYGKEENLIWYFRTGYHYHDVCDIKQLANVIRNHLDLEPLSDTYFNAPFNDPELIFDWKCPTAKN